VQYTKKDFSNLLEKTSLSNKTLEIHFSLYEGYVGNTNKLSQKLQEISKDSPEYAEMKRRFGWEWNGMRLHELYFENLGGSGEISEKEEIYKNIEKSFGNFENWKNDFLATAKMRGIGWTILYQDENGELFNFWINEHDEGHPSGLAPILVLDVFEHAYFPDFGKDRTAYLEAFMKSINWEIAEERLTPLENK
jgi:superoxide dismutase, Fe-Mn family